MNAIRILRSLSVDMIATASTSLIGANSAAAQTSVSVSQERRVLDLAETSHDEVTHTAPMGTGAIVIYTIDKEMNKDTDSGTIIVEEEQVQVWETLQTMKYLQSISANAEYRNQPLTTTTTKEIKYSGGRKLGKEVH